MLVTFIMDGGIFSMNERDDKKTTLAASLVKAQKSFGAALKTSTNPHYRSKYADLAACIEAVIDALNDNGIMLMQQLHESTDSVTVETIFLHESGEMLSAGKLSLPVSKKDSQGFGSALTYARRYSLMTACGIAPEDDDGNAASKAAHHKPDITDFLAAIEATSTLEELQAIFLEGQAICKGYKDLVEQVVAAKDKAKARLTQTGN